MKQKDGARYVPGYDLFKLIVAVILTIILVMLLLQENQRRFAALEMTETERAAVPTMTSQAPLPTPSLPATSTEIPAAETPSGAAIVTPSPTVVTPTQETVAVVTPSATAESPSDLNDCPSNPPRIQTGDTVVVKDWLNFRAGPGLNYSIQHTNRPGTEMEVLGGPACTIKAGDPPRAYLWWNVRMQDGREGWSAEAPLNFPNYFLEPVR